MLPGRSGLDILRTLRRRDPHAPVLLLTARDMVEDRVQGLDSGADDYLVKTLRVPRTTRPRPRARAPRPARTGPAPEGG